MSRIPLVDIESVEFMQILANRPEVMQKWTELDTAAMFQGTLSPRLKYQVQTALAENGSCRFCLSLIKPMTVEDRQEAAAIDFAIACQMDPAGITDAQFEELHELFTPAQVVELCVVIAFKIGGLALGAMWALGPADPGVKEGYDAIVDEAQRRWESGQPDGADSLWQSHAGHALSADATATTGMK